MISSEAALSAAQAGSLAAKAKISAGRDRENSESNACKIHSASVVSVAYFLFLLL